MIALVLLAVAFATLLIISYLVFIWWLDRYEREPLWLVFLTFIWGGLGGTCLSCIINSTVGAGLLEVVGESASQVMTTVIVAPVVEEVMKGLVFVALLNIGNNIDNRTDGLIYGAATGLGFAAMENLWYYANGFDAANPGGLLPTIFLRTLFTSLVHCVSSALLGMAIGYARHRSGAARWLVWPALGYVLAVVNHGTWNGLATLMSVFGEQEQELAGLTLLFSCSLVLGASAMMFIMTQISLHAEHKFIRHYLLEEARRGVLPTAHAEIIPYWTKRRRRGWAPKGINKEEYIKTATLLAFRHRQLEIADGDRKHQYMEDITKFRERLQKLLLKASR